MLATADGDANVDSTTSMAQEAESGQIYSYRNIHGKSDQITQ